MILFFFFSGLSIDKMRNNINLFSVLSKLNYEHQFQSGAERERHCSRKANGKMAFGKFKSSYKFEYRYCILSSAIESTASNKLEAQRIILTVSIICSFVRFIDCLCEVVIFPSALSFYPFGVDIFILSISSCRFVDCLVQCTIQRVYTRFSYSWYEFNEKSM